MFDFRKLNVSELRAISGDLGLKQNKSATQSELAAKVADYFQANDVVSVMASLDRKRIQNVARKLSVRPLTGTNREIAQRVVDAVLAGTVSFKDPEPKKKTAGPKPEEKDPKNPNKETRKGFLGLPLLAWVLIVAAVIFIGWLAFRPRQAAPVSIDEEKIAEAVASKIEIPEPVSAKEIGDAVADSIRLALAEQDTAGESETEVEEPVVEEPVEDLPVEEPEDIVVEADQTFVFRGQVPAYSDFRSAVREPGDTATFDLYFEVALKGATIPRVWPDDTLLSATLLVPGKDPVDLTNLFEMIFVSKGGTGDAELDKSLQARGVNTAEGEILMQNKNIVSLGDVPAGTHVVFEIKDNEELQVNRGIGVVIDTYTDAFTVSLP